MHIEAHSVPSHYSCTQFARTQLSETIDQIFIKKDFMPITAQPRRSNIGVVGSNPTLRMNVCFFLYLYYPVLLQEPLVRTGL
jgi:hypothetical protein